MSVDCRWTGTETPRALVGRHEDDCRDEWCKGCLRCPRFHCIICGIEHVDEQTCPGCLGAARDELQDTLRLHVALRAHALEGGNDGKLEAARPIPGGEALVMLGPTAPKGEIGPSDHQTTEEVLVSWEEDWRSVKQQPTDDLVSLYGAAAYLAEHMTWAAQNHDAFDAFVTEVRQHRAHLENILHDGERKETGAPCGCGRPLERIYANTTANDRWWCDTCKIGLDPAEYVDRVSKDARKHKGWLTARDMELEHRVKRGTLTGWAATGKVGKRKDFNLGRMVYNVADTLKARDMSEGDDIVRDVS